MKGHLALAVLLLVLTACASGCALCGHGYLAVFCSDEDICGPHPWDGRTAMCTEKSSAREKNR